VSAGLHQQAANVAALARDKAAETEQLRKLHPDVLAALQSESLPQLIKDGGTIRDYVDVCGILAQGCMSTGWCNFVWGMHQHLISLFPTEVKHAVWADPKELVSASLQPVGQVNALDADSVTLTGRWRFNSGCDYAGWLLLGANTDDSEPCLALVHESEYQIDDTWQVMGLRGTGSKDAVCDAVRLPRNRLLPFSQAIAPYGALLILVIVGPVVGGAQSAVDEYAKQISDHNDNLALVRLAEASAEVDTARMLVQSAADILDVNLAPDNALTWQIIRDTVFAAKLCNQSTRRVFEAAGGSALHESKPLQRIFRDVTAGCAHAKLRWESNALPYGKHLAQKMKDHGQG